jgi:hypothetical protein
VQSDAEKSSEEVSVEAQRYVRYLLVLLVLPPQHHHFKDVQSEEAQTLF